MNIEHNTVVQFHYDLLDAQGEQIESSRDRDPLAYLHGHNNILAALEAELLGKKAGDSLTATLTPEQAYGVRDENAVQRISIKHLQGAKKWQPGMVALVHTEHGTRQVTVLKVGLKHADCDINHPLAGETLTFNIDVVDVRKATDEEVEHGHAHGVGGHHH